MICNLYFEAAHEPDVGQVAVGNTVVTRLFNQGFPVSGKAPTTCNIVWDRAKGTAQYSWTLESKSHAMTNSTTLARIAKNARTAMCSKPGTYTNYWSPSAMVPAYSKPSWADACQDKVTLGIQIFCRFPAQAAVTRSVRDVATAEGIVYGPTLPDSGVSTSN